MAIPVRSIRLTPRSKSALDRTTGTRGEIFFDATAKTLRVFDGVKVGGSLLSASVSVSDTPPVSPSQGSLWFNSSNGSLYLYYEDTDSEQWITPVTYSGSGGGSGSGIVSPGTAGKLAFYPSNGTTVDDLSQVSWANNTLTVTGSISVSDQKNFIRFHWDTLADLNAEANPTTWHGMIAHVHETGRVYFAHSGAWTPLANQSDVIGGGSSTLAALTDVNVTGVSDGQVLKYSTAENKWIPAADLQTSGDGGVALTSFSVSTTTASGGGALAYNNITGVFTFTPSVTGVTSTSIVTANGFSGSVANSTTTPAITISTSVTGLIKGNGLAISAAVAGTDYQLPLPSQTGNEGRYLSTNGTVLSWDLLPAGVTTLAELTDVNIAGATDGQVLKYSTAQNKWIPAADLTGAGGTGISLSDLSASTATASGTGSLTYNNSSGVFTFTPPNLSSFITLNSISATGDISYNSSTGVISFNNNSAYITRTGISVTQATASGNGSLLYSNSTGVFTFTPADLSSVAASNSFTTIAVSGQSNVVADNATDTLTLVAGSGISITTNASTDTVTITNTGSAGEANQNAFSSVAVSGQSNVVADSATDTLTLAAGTGISITTDAGTDTVTIAATGTGGASTFSALTDNAGLTIDRIYLPAITMLSTTNNGSSSYRFDQYGTTDNPTVYAINGTTIAFNLSVSGHPFLIQTSGGSNFNTGLTHVSTTGAVTTGSSAQGQTSGTLYWKIPSSISGNYRYICSIHGSMVGTITIKDIAVI